MEKIRIKVYVETNRVGSRTEDEIELEIEDGLQGDARAEAIEAEARDWMFENIEFGWLEMRITE